MIAIDVTMSKKDKTPFDSLVDAKPLISQSHKNIFDFFQNCIDQNLVLNASCNISQDTQINDITRYFATTIENAQTFQNAFADMSAEFSMKKMWDEVGFDISFEQHEVDFDKELGVMDLISSDGRIWAAQF
jgi:hypothetical protein